MLYREVVQQMWVCAPYAAFTAVLGCTALIRPMRFAAAICELEVDRTCGSHNPVAACGRWSVRAWVSAWWMSCEGRMKLCAFVALEPVSELGRTRFGDGERWM